MQTVHLFSKSIKSALKKLAHLTCNSPTSQSKQRCKDNTSNANFLYNQQDRIAYEYKQQNPTLKTCNPTVGR